MTSQPANRYRPILRLNDLLHPIQQRERAIEFATINEQIGSYRDYSRLWASSQMPELFLVKAPRSTSRLTEEVYFVLIKQRVNWMIQTWMQTARTNLVETQRMLETKLNCCENHPLDVPILDEDIDGQTDSRVV